MLKDVLILRRISEVQDHNFKKAIFSDFLNPMNNEQLTILKKFKTITRILKNLTSCLKNFEIVRVKSHVTAPLRLAAIM